MLDTTLTGDHVGVAAYISRGLSLGDKPLATEFVAVPCEVQYGEVEKVGGEWRGRQDGGLERSMGRWRRWGGDEGGTRAGRGRGGGYWEGTELLERGACGEVAGALLGAIRGGALSALP